MIVVFQRENTQDLIVFMYRFAKVPSLLLVVPIAIGIAVLSLDRRGVDVVVVLHGFG